jgi:hypothetical protein
MLRFAEEEVKHQLLFRRFIEAFSQGFGSPCGGIPSQEAVAGVILSKSPMAVMMITLHLEVMTQQHYVQCFSDESDDLDPVFKKLLKSHWAEESQHAKLDALTLRRLATGSAREARTQAVKDYVDLLDALEGLLKQQAEMDIKSLSTATGKTYTPEQTAQLLETQAKAYRQTFVTWGVTNPTFMETVEELFPEDVSLIKDKVAKLL